MLKRYSKALPAVVGLLGQVVAANVVQGTALHYCQVALAALTAIGVVFAPENTKA